MSWIYTNIFIFIMAILLAILEIQIEGKHGWAGKLPTWRPKKTPWFLQIYQKIIGNREITGYHLSLFAYVLFIFHLPFFLGTPFTWENWFRIISLFLLYIVVWDFLWFVMNPHYPLKKFRQEHVLWHKKWWLFAPSDYFICIVLSFLVLIPYDQLHPQAGLLAWWLAHVLLFAAETILVILFTLYVLKIDNWHNKK